MAIYEYVCKTCKKEEERWVPMSEARKQYCVEYYKPLTKKMSVPGYVWAPTKDIK